jgi:hypothetical protein
VSMLRILSVRCRLDLCSSMDIMYIVAGREHPQLRVPCLRPGDWMAPNPSPVALFYCAGSRRRGKRAVQHAAGADPRAFVLNDVWCMTTMILQQWRAVNRYGGIVCRIHGH